MNKEKESKLNSSEENYIQNLIEFVKQFKNDEENEVGIKVIKNGEVIDIVEI